MQTDKILKDIKHLLETDATITELSDIDKFKLENSYGKELLNEFSDEVTLEEKLTEYKRIEESKKKSVERLRNEINTSVTKPTRRLRLKLIASIGAVAAALLFLTLLIYDKSADTSPIIAQSEVIKEYSVPTLILHSGEAVAVADVEKVAQINDNIMSTVADSKLKYDAAVKTDSVILNKLIVPSQNTYTVVLADGSEVTLNANSTLEYPVEFSDNSREIHLSGEAFFDVKKSDKPFIVVMNDERVQVYGTQFNIKCIKNRSTEVVLVEGSIGYKNSNIEEVILTPNQLLVREVNKSDVVVCEVNTNDYTTWREKRFKHINQNLHTILSDIAQWYGVEFKIKNKNDNLIYTFISRKDISLESVIRQISTISDVTIINEGGGMYIVE